MDFSKLRKGGSNLSKLTEKLESMNSGGSKKDERIYKPGFDRKESTGYAVIRFLPNKNGDPFVRRFSHQFKGKNGWYFENSRSTIDGEKDPVGISNGLYWAKGEAEGNESFKNIARSRKRNTKYYANVYVEKDTVSPEYNGKVMIYEFGPQIFKLIEDAIKPKFEDDDPIDPFDLWNGASLKIKIEGREIPDSRTGQKTVVPNYEKSEFARESELFPGDDAQKEEVFNQTYDLSEFIVVKPFDELAKRFKDVTGEAYNALDGGDPADKIVEELNTQSKLQTEQAEPEPQKEDLPFDPDPKQDEEEDDVMAMLQNLARDAQ
jgi:hypothetical protein